MSRRSSGFGKAPQMNPKNLMRQVQQMQSQMESIQEEAHKEVIEVSSGGGMVSLAINGALEVQHIEISPEVVDPDDMEPIADEVTSDTVSE